MLKTAINRSVAQTTISNSIACMQCVQYHRKPRWIPQAKSKIFRVPERKKQNEDEKAELLRLNSVYKTQVRAIRSYLVKEYYVNLATSTADHVVLTPEEEAAEIEKCTKINDAWNASIAEIRNQRLEKESKVERELILSRLELKIQRDEDAKRAAEEAVRLEKERSKTFILKGNLDQAIEYALANPVDYNFGITLDAEILNGRTSIDDKAAKSATATN